MLSNTTSHDTKLIRFQSASINERQKTESRCFNRIEIENFSHLKPDDLPFLIILYQIFEKNLLEFDNLLHDLRYIGESIAELNEKTFLVNNEQSYLQQQRFKLMINTLSMIKFLLNKFLK